MKHSFRDPVTQVLKAWGFTDQNVPGDLSQEESDAFALEPGKWQWNGTRWIPFLPVPLPPNPLIALLNVAVADPTIPASLKAVLAQWKAQL